MQFGSGFSHPLPVAMPTKSENRITDLSRDSIAQRAYEIWEREGRPEGRAFDHWLAAEAELRPTATVSRATSPAAVATKPQRRTGSRQTEMVA